MPKTYSQYHHGTSPNPSHSRQRSWGTPAAHTPSSKRVWVRKEDGPPTTLMMGPHDLVDDLKLAITYKYPTTLARQFDPADLSIQLKIPDEPVKKHKPKQSSLNRLVSEQEDSYNAPVSRSPSLPATSSFESPFVTLEPDQNVWDILDEYFGGKMSMADALLVVASHRHASMPSYAFEGFPERTNSRPLEFGSAPNHQRASYTDLPNHPTNNLPLRGPPRMNPNPITKNSSVSPSLTHRLSPINGAINVHKRSHSNPPQSPSMTSINQITKNNGQAVLLLPKNFTLGEQNHLKRYSLDDSMMNKSYSNASKDSGNVTSIGVPQDSELSNDEEKPNTGQRKTSHELTRTTSGTNNGSRSTDRLSETKSSRSVEEKSKSSSNNISNGSSGAGALSKDSSSHSDLSPADVREAKPTSTFERVLPSLSVLVVEDNAINQAILGAFLRKHKIRYQIAKNGQEAVDKWRKGGFHLVLMDIQLPVKSGIEATKEIRYLEKVNRIGVFAQHELSKSNGEASIKDDERLDLKVFRSPVIIVALTASSNSSVDKKNALTAGCNDFLTKPVNLVWLQNKITEWGCMQALIDYDGWKVKRSANGEPPKVAVKSLPHHKHIEKEKPLTA
ncbi:Two-component response regulator SSK1p [Candidozyma auris]